MNADARRMFFSWRTLSETMFMYLSFISSKGRNVHSHLKVIILYIASETNVHVFGQRTFKPHIKRYYWFNWAAAKV